ncbi:hypothetical protein T459_23776 [Capsicum annuum]|uniref:Uncharacterized protein n=1 Tax=Capsicum annuum TaxID=4072 RepID=A0A2G2YTP0_CAPAN|nr:hypothetical protein FXO37_17574 [Capsicum annuum]PHT72991.1 hypothetical protein T459_23776 [Capsicum annuum]
MGFKLLWIGRLCGKISSLFILTIIVGDYNAVLDVDDRVGGSPVQAGEINDFNDFLFDTGMNKLQYYGRPFTWTNHYLFGKIDTTLVNGDWMMQSPQVQVHVMDPHFYDYSPLNLKTCDDPRGGSKPFRFLNCLAKYEDFTIIVRLGWKKNQESGTIEIV